MYTFRRRNVRKRITRRRGRQSQRQRGRQATRQRGRQRHGGTSTTVNGNTVSVTPLSDGHSAQVSVNGQTGLVSVIDT